MEIMRRLHRNFSVEFTLYFCVYILYLLYGLWKLYNLRDPILRIAQYEFSSGWSWINRPRDDSNDELQNFTEYIHHMWPWYILHLLASSLMSIRWPSRQSTGLCIVCMIALACTLKAVSIAIFLTLLFSYFVTAQTGSKHFIWILAGLWMLLIILIKQNTILYNILGYREYYTLIVMLSWSMLRGCSFALSRANDFAAGQEMTIYSVENYLGYTLHLPTLVFGPLISFRRYAVICSRQQQAVQLHSLSTRSITLIWELTRCLFWWFVLQVLQHFLYLDYMTRDVSALYLLQPSFSHHAVGYFLGQFFFMYYVFTYGVGIAFARFDGMEPQPRPRCIGRIHFYSDMWKYFDAGLYEFLFQHIYATLCGKHSSFLAKLSATAATFSFVFIWHGCYMYVLIWSVLNFGCLVAEKCFKTAVTSRYYTEWVRRNLSERAAQRLYALLGTQIFIPAAFANVYFIGGREVGDFLMRSAYTSGIMNYVALTFCSYCFFQCSEVILNTKAKYKI